MKLWMKLQLKKRKRQQSSTKVQHLWNRTDRPRYSVGAKDSVPPVVLAAAVYRTAIPRIDPVRHTPDSPNICSFQLFLLRICHTRSPVFPAPGAAMSRFATVSCNNGSLKAVVDLALCCVTGGVQHLWWSCMLRKASDLPESC